jgi:hypothetical protein
MGFSQKRFLACARAVRLFPALKNACPDSCAGQCELQLYVAAMSLPSQPMLPRNEYCGMAQGGQVHSPFPNAAS